MFYACLFCYIAAVINKAVARNTTSVTIEFRFLSPLPIIKELRSEWANHKNYIACNIRYHTFKLCYALQKKLFFNKKVIC